MARTLASDNTAYLRAFNIIDDGIRSRGIRRKLVERGGEVCGRQGAFKETRLWTLKGLDAARKLYMAFGFVLVERKRQGKGRKCWNICLDKDGEGLEMCKKNERKSTKALDRHANGVIKES